MHKDKRDDQSYPEEVPDTERPERFVDTKSEAGSGETGDQTSAVGPELVPSEPNEDAEPNEDDESETEAAP